MNGVGNATYANSPNLTTPPNFQKFYEMLGMLMMMREQHLFDFYLTLRNGQFNLLMQINKKGSNSPYVKKFKEILDIPQSENSLYIVQSSNAHQGAEITVEIRSFLGVMGFLSHAVQDPEESIKKG